MVRVKNLNTLCGEIHAMNEEDGRRIAIHLLPVELWGDISVVRQDFDPATYDSMEKTIHQWVEERKVV